jgi:hypothetical protein
MRKTFVRFCEGLGNNWCYTPGGPRLLDNNGILGLEDWGHGKKVLSFSDEGIDK